MRKSLQKVTKNMKIAKNMRKNGIKYEKNME